jgi:hypothetical protein
MATRGKLNEKVHETIVSTIRSGSFLTVAAQKAGISSTTFRGWMERGEMEQARIEEGFDPNPDEIKYLRLKEEVDIARAVAEVEAVKIIRSTAASGTWQAAAWYLERSFPQRWARNRAEEAQAEKEQADPQAALEKLLHKLDALDSGDE